MAPPNDDPTLPGATGGTPSDPGFWGTWGGPIATGAGGVVGAIASRKAQQDAMVRSPEEAANLAGAGGAAGGAGSAATSLMTGAKPYLKNAGSYYQTLLNGNRAAMAQATAAPRAQLQEAYRGAATGLAQSGIRGAAKDVLAGNLQRQGAGQIAGLTTGVQPAAATALGALGSDMAKTAAPLYGTAGNIYSNLLNNGLYNRQQAMAEGSKTGAAAGKLVADLGGSVAGALAKRTTQPKKASGTPGDTPTQPGNTVPYGPPPPPPPADYSDQLYGYNESAPVAAPLDYSDQLYGYGT
jgi:hypothetical protein